jgi:hypothetical protein
MHTSLFWGRGPFGPWPRACMCLNTSQGNPRGMGRSQEKMQVAMGGAGNRGDLILLAHLGGIAGHATIDAGGGPGLCQQLVPRAGDCRIVRG